MIRVMGCETTRELLPAFVDGELPVGDQVVVEAHLRWCRTCAAHVEDLRTIGDALRLRAPQSRREDDSELPGLQAGILTRLQAERDQSWTTKAHLMFEDLRAFWAGIGATVGMTACLFLTVGVITATDDRATNSMASVLDTMASPGSNRNPVSLDSGMLPPRLSIPEMLDDAPQLKRIPKDDAVFALATVVTREGHIADYELLSDNPSASHSDLIRLRDGVRKLHFAPALAGGSPVAVNMVWLLARTTVKGSPKPFDFDEPARLRANGSRRVG